MNSYTSENKEDHKLKENIMKVITKENYDLIQKREYLEGSIKILQTNVIFIL